MRVKGRKKTEFLTQRAREVHVGTRGIYGAPRIHAQLVEEGYKAGKNRVARGS